MANLLNVVEQNVSSLMGLPIKEIKEMSASDIRHHIEQHKNAELAFVSDFPFIGRGNVLRDNLITTAELDSNIDSILNND
jgi:hypothetical protein